MSMNLFFVAFTQEELDEMDENHELIDEAVDSESHALSTDIETAWDVLRKILDGAGIQAGKDIDDALFNGCSLISSDEVNAHAAELSAWSREKVLAGLQALDKDADLYHLDVFRSNTEYLLQQFEKMVAFYREAADKGLGVISYAA